MKRKKRKNKKDRRTSVVSKKIIFLPNWKYQCLMQRLERQDKVISELFYQVDDLSYNFKRFTKLYAI